MDQFALCASLQNCYTHHHNPFSCNLLILFLSSSFLLSLILFTHQVILVSNCKWDSTYGVLWVLILRYNCCQSYTVWIPVFFHVCWMNQSILLIRNINPLKPELYPICYLLALLAHHFLHVSRIRVKSLTIRLLMSYIYGAPILDVSRSHTTTQHSR